MTPCDWCMNDKTRQLWGSLIVPATHRVVFEHGAGVANLCEADKNAAERSSYWLSTEELTKETP